jgi:outer membrane receptor protein involved in Fe transport
VPYTPGTTMLSTGATTATLVSGNPLLKPESARTVTAGVVLQPTDTNWIATFDWYDVTITNAIAAPGAQKVADECVDLPSIVNPFCAAITRTTGGSVPGSLSQISVTQINVASFETAGVDFTVTYSKETRDWFGEDYGTLNFHLLGNYLNTLTTTALPGTPPVQSANVGANPGLLSQTAPRWQANLDIVWAYEKWTVDYNIDWYGNTLRTDRQTLAAAPDEFAPQFIWFPDRVVQSVQVNYEVSPGWTVYGGIDNLFYQKPTIGENGVPVSPLGRFFYGGLRANVDFSDLGL